MSIRYIYGSTLIAAGAFLVVASQAFSETAFAWLAFAVAAGAVIASLGILPARTGLAQRLLSGTALAVAGWTVVASLVFAAGSFLWLGFAAGIALFAIGLGGLTAHELKTERVVHSIEVSGERASAIA